MTTIGRPPSPTTLRTTSTSATPAASPKTAASSSAATGDTFSAAPAVSGVRAALDSARTMLDGLDQSAAVTDLKKLLEKPVPSKSDFDKVIEHYSELAPNLSDADRQTLEKALSYQLMGRSALDQFKQQMEKILAELGKKAE